MLIFLFTILSPLSARPSFGSLRHLDVFDKHATVTNSIERQMQVLSVTSFAILDFFPGFRAGGMDPTLDYV
jgi:hypothetical protein